jgi:hypothetical protein
VARLTWRRVTLTAATTAGLGWLAVALLARSGGTPAVIPWTLPPLLVATAGLALWLGWRVKQFRDGKRPDLDPIQAVRAAMFGQASAYAGAALAGAYLGYAIGLLPDWSHEPRREIIVSAIIALAAAAVLCAAGWIAERWCATDAGDAAPPDASASAA